jgi:hypothetical protein
MWVNLGGSGKTARPSDWGAQGKPLHETVPSCRLFGGERLKNTCRSISQMTQHLPSTKRTPPRRRFGAQRIQALDQPLEGSRNLDTIHATVHRVEQSGASFSPRDPEQNTANAPSTSSA